MTKDKTDCILRDFKSEGGENKQMILTNEQKYYSQKGKKYRTYDGFGNHWDIIIKGVRHHSEGSLWVEHFTMKNDSGEWIDDGSHLNGLIMGVQQGETLEID